MSSHSTRRGRPRGSGLDDRVQLRRVAELLDADPALKPTTAIRALGVTDPSTIRRLRDKLKTDHHIREHAHVASQATPARGRSAELLEARSTGVPARPDHPSGAAFTTGSVQMHAPQISEDQLSWFAHWCALGLSAVSSTVEAQLAVMDDFFRVPQVTSVLRHQLLMNEVAKSFCPKRTDVRSTLH